MKKKVVIVKIEDYRVDNLTKRLKEVVERHFSLGDIFSRQDKILLKPNLLMAASPGEAITTHPNFIEAVGRIFKERGHSVSIADGSGGFGTENMSFIYQECGVKEAAERCGFRLLYPTVSFSYEGLPLCWWVNVNQPEGRNLPGAIKESPFKIVNLPKLKTHGIMVLTSAVKNTYGCISGVYKSRLHMIYPRAEELSAFLLKLYRMIKPSLHIVDGILALEGEGPAKKGIPRKLGIVAVGNDALGIDFALGRILGLADEDNPLIKRAKEQGLLKDYEEGGEGEIISEIEEGYFKDFKFPHPFLVNRLPRSFSSSVFKMFFKFRPTVERKRCTSCWACREICPAGAIREKRGRARIDYRKCIMCMCCSEVCRAGAVYIRKSAPLRFAGTIQKIIRQIYHG